MFAAMLLALLACGVPHRVEKSLVPADYVTEATPTGELVDVTVSTGDRGSTPGPWAPEAVEVGGRRYVRAVELTTTGWIELTPQVPDLSVSVWVRSNGLARHDFTRVVSITGALPGEVANEVRFLPTHLSEPLHLSLRDLSNVYNDYDLNHGDLLLVQVEAPDHAVERYLFLKNEFGIRVKYGGGFLVTVPLSFLGGPQPERAAPVLVFTTAFGYRFRTRSPILRWFGGKSAILLSTGVGSTALDADFSVPLEEQVRGQFNAMVTGGGLEFYDFVSVQALVNVSALGRDLYEAPWVLAIGFDAVQLGLFKIGRAHV